MPEFEANMNYIPQSPPSSMKQCNKSATVKFHMELILTTATRKQSCSCATPLIFRRHQRKNQRNGRLCPVQLEKLNDVTLVRPKSIRSMFSSTMDTMVSDRSRWYCHIKRNFRPSTDRFLYWIEVLCT